LVVIGFFFGSPSWYSPARSNYHRDAIAGGLVGFPLLSVRSSFCAPMKTRTRNVFIFGNFILLLNTAILFIIQVRFRRSCFFLRSCFFRRSCFFECHPSASVRAPAIAEQCSDPAPTAPSWRRRGGPHRSRPLWSPLTHAPGSCFGGCAMKNGYPQGSS